MSTLALDPGTRCGWALRLDGGTLASGTWDLAPQKLRRFEGAGMRWVRLRRYLDELVSGLRLDLVVLEEVRAHKGTAAAHVYGGIVATVQAWCEGREIPYTAIPVSHVKRAATGKGNCGKPAMIAAAREQWPGQDVADDNQADALWLLECADEMAGEVVEREP